MPTIKQRLLDAVCTFTAQVIADRLSEVNGLTDQPRQPLIEGIAAEIKKAILKWPMLDRGQQ